MDYVNRDERGYVDFEKMIGLDGIAIINIVSNPGNASLTGKKDLRTLISHNDGLCYDGFLGATLTLFPGRGDLEANHTSKDGLSWPKV